MKSGPLYGKVPPVVADKIVIALIVVPGNATPEIITSLLPPNTIPDGYAIAGAAVSVIQDTLFGTTDSIMSKLVKLDNVYIPPVSDWVNHTYISTNAAGAGQATVELYLSRYNPATPV